MTTDGSPACVPSPMRAKGHVTPRSDAGHHHVFDLDILIHAVARAFAAEAAFLDAAERCDLGRDQAGVDADHARLQCLGDTPDAADVTRIEVGGEAER